LKKKLLTVLLIALLVVSLVGAAFAAAEKGKVESVDAAKKTVTVKVDNVGDLKAGDSVEISKAKAKVGC
jgi:ABC-type transporter Mla subunit MlaD